MMNCQYAKCRWAVCRGAIFKIEDFKLLFRSKVIKDCDGKVISNIGRALEQEELFTYLFDIILTFLG
jgi:hypothetical protein